jgi:glucokinase
VHGTNSGREGALEKGPSVKEYVARLRTFSRVKRANLSSVMHVLLTQGPNSRAAIARSTRLSPPTVSRLVNELAGHGIITEAGPSQKGDLGAPASILSFNAGLGFVIGIDVGETTTQLALADLSGSVRHRLNLPTRGQVGGDATVEQLARGCRQILEKSKVSKTAIWSACIGIPGIADKEGHVNAPDIVGWWRFPLKQKVEQYLPSEIILENTTNLAVVGEQKDGCAKGHRNVAFVSIRAGIGAGLMIGGHLFRGANGAAGEIGFMVPGIETPPLDKRGHGALEMQAGIEPLLKMLGAKAHALEIVEEGFNLERLFAEAANGDPDCLQVVNVASQYYAQAIVNLVSVLNPELLVIGGDVCPAGDIVLGVIREKVESFFPYPPQVRLSSLGGQAALHGALWVALRAAHAKLGIAASSADPSV